MYEQLQSEAAMLNIEVHEKILRKRIKGLYGDNVIWINKSIRTTIEKACVLAEEIGHHQTTTGDILDQSKLLNVKQERKARSWAAHKLVPLNSLIDAFKGGCTSRFEIAEFLQVTEEFLDESLRYYHEKYGEKVRVDDKHILFFSPLGVFEDLS